MSTKFSEKHVAARAAVEAGFPVFPCLPNSKSPACPNGLYDATLDLGQIDRWWTAEPELNPAMCPDDVGLAVIDLDPGHREPLLLPPTYEVRTPRGGSHLYYQGSLPCTVGKIGDNIDTRGRGGYVLLPGARVNGGTYEVVHDRDIIALPDWVLDKTKQHHRRSASDVVEVDERGNILRARSRIFDLLGSGQHGVIGRRNDQTYRLACELYGMALSPEMVRTLLSDLWNPASLPPLDQTELQSIVDHAAEYRQNDVGVDAVHPAAEVFAGNPALDKLLLAPQPQDRSRFFLPGFGDPEYDPGIEPVAVGSYLDNPAEPPELQTLVPAWIEQGIYIPLIGIGGTHKSRLILQIALCLLYGRHPFRPNHPLDNENWKTISHFCLLSYENTKEENQRRSRAMRDRVRLIETERSQASFDIWELRDARTPIMIIGEKNIDLTAFGYRLLTKLEKIKGHKVLLLDSFFNSIAFTGKTKVIDDCAAYVIETLDYWAKILDMTIISPFHPSRAGASRGDLGYSPAFSDRARQSLGIREIEPKKKGEVVPAGVYELYIDKWNNGRKGKRTLLRYDAGAMIETTEDTGTITVG